MVLAAGGSSRLGSPKQLVRLGDENLLERAVRVASEAGCGPVVVVLGASAEVIRSQSVLGDACVVVNDDWASGMGGSIAVGVGALQGVDGCVVMTCDMPAVTAAHLRLLMRGEITASSYSGRKGVPVLLSVWSVWRVDGVVGGCGGWGVVGGGSVCGVGGWGVGCGYGGGFGAGAGDVWVRFRGPLSEPLFEFHLDRESQFS